MNLKQIIGEYNLGLSLRKKSFTADQNSESAKGIGIIFAAESLLHQQVVTKFQEKIQNLTHEQTHLFGYVNKKLDSQVTFAFSHFSQTDVGIRPDFSKHKVAIFMQRHYRVCINLDVDNYKIIHYVMANTHAVHKLAISPDYPKLYNIIVNKDANDEFPFIIDKTLEIFKKTVGL